MNVLVVSARFAIMVCLLSACSTKSDTAPNKSQAAQLFVTLASTNLGKDVKLSADPNPAPYGPNNGSYPVVTINWSDPSAHIIEIHIKSPTGVLFTRGDGAGSQRTDAWVAPGTAFFMQDVSSGSPGKTVGILRASSCSSCH